MEFSLSEAVFLSSAGLLSFTLEIDVSGLRSGAHIWSDDPVGCSTGVLVATNRTRRPGTARPEFQTVVGPGWRSDGWLLPGGDGHGKSIDGT